MGKEAYKFKQICTECLCYIRHYKGLCPGLVVFTILAALNGGGVKTTP